MRKSRNQEVAKLVVNLKISPPKIFAATLAVGFALFVIRVSGGVADELAERYKEDIDALKERITGHIKNADLFPSRKKHAV